MDHRADPTSLQPLVVVPWRDPIVDRIGHPADGPYVETYWLGTLGPTATWLLRRLAAVLRDHPAGTVIDRGDLATSLGLGVEPGRVNALRRAEARLEMFGLARTVDRDLAVRLLVPPLTTRQLDRLPRDLRESHDENVGRTGSGRVSVSVC